MSLSRAAGAVSTVAALVFMAMVPHSAYAGVYAAPALKWSAFSARSEHGESTPNYYGYGIGLGAGYSIEQVVDVGAYGVYLPGQLDAARPGADDATLSSYGGELALRLDDSVYVGLRGGIARYDLRHPSRPEELRGKWHGPAGGFSLGAVQRLGPQSFFQTSLDVMHTVVDNDRTDVPTDGVRASESSGKRRLDAFSLSIAYVYAGASVHHAQNGLMQSFLDTLSFF